MKFTILALFIAILPMLTDIRIRKWLKRSYQRISLRRNAKLFENNYLESKSLYLHCFRQIPCTTYIDGIDLGKAFAHIDSSYKDLILDTYQACLFNRQEKKQEFQKTLFVLHNKVLIELSYEHVSILYPGKLFAFADHLLKTLDNFRMPEKVEDFEINIITSSAHGLELKRLEIKPVELDTCLFYNDDFKEVDTLIKTRLNRSNDKGIVLLHGLPGTGKTSYLRHLIGELKKKVLFVSPTVASNLMNPEFIDLLIDNPNAVLVIEDAENIMMDRKFNSDSSVSNLLNLSDGLLSDCVNVQIICTFNSSLNLIDSALMRKGRLIARYEFGRLGIEKAQKLSDHLGFNVRVTQPLTLAEIAHPAEKDPETPKPGMIGFRQDAVMN